MTKLIPLTFTDQLAHAVAISMTNVAYVRPTPSGVSIHFTDGTKTFTDDFSKLEKVPAFQDLVQIDKVSEFDAGVIYVNPDAVTHIVGFSPPHVGCTLYLLSVPRGFRIDQALEEIVAKFAKAS